MREQRYGIPNRINRLRRGQIAAHHSRGDSAGRKPREAMRQQTNYNPGAQTSQQSGTPADRCSIAQENTWRSFHAKRSYGGCGALQWGISRNFDSGFLRFRCRSINSLSAARNALLSRALAAGPDADRLSQTLLSFVSMLLCLTTRPPRGKKFFPQRQLC
jgi:hypothetical protein